MTSLIGMDSGEVRSYAARLRGQAGALMAVIGQVDGIIHQISQHWHGSAAAEFVSTWQHRHRPNLMRIHQQLSGLAQSADNNAQQQDRASGASGAAKGSRGSGLWSNGPDATQDRQLEAQVVSQTRHMSQQQQIAWWNQLPDDQKWMYLTTIPAFLATMPAFSADMNAYAETDRIEVGETGTLTGTGSFKVFSFKAGVDESITMDQMANKQTDVTITGGILAGAAKGVQVDGASGSVGASIEGDKSVTYRFSSSEQAKAFYDQLIKGATSGPKGIETVAGNIRQATSDPNLDVVSRQVEGRLTGSVQISAGAHGEKVALGGDASVTYIRDEAAHTQTFQYSIDGHAAAQNLGVGASAQGSASVAVVTGTGSNTSVQQIVISGQYSDAITTGSGHHDVSSGAGGSYSIAITPDATNQHAVAALLKDLASGNSSGASAQLGELSKNATVIGQTDVSSSAATGFQDQWGWGPAKVGVSGSLETDSTTYTQTDVKAAGAAGTMDFPG